MTLVNHIEDDEFTFAQINQQEVMILRPTPLDHHINSEWHGSLVLTREYLLHLIHISLYHQLINADDITHYVNNLSAQKGSENNKVIELQYYRKA